MYIASGTSTDWALGVAKIPYSYTMELRDKGKYKFFAPPQEIIPTAQDTWAFHVAVLRDIMSRSG